MIGQGQVHHRVDAVGSSPGVHRELTEGIGSLPGWRKGFRQKKIETHRKIIDDNGPRSSVGIGLGWMIQWDLTRSSLGDPSKGSETRLGHARRSPEEDRMTYRKNVGGYRIGESWVLV
ncbi:hypothetical protein BHM03_00059231 [Ensete ventricosum]|nr:hypothetical protein BHM03_00059231 [Ensete ventricosum]